jgi:hypothetical protein
VGAAGQAGSAGGPTPHSLIGQTDSPSLRHGERSGWPGSPTPFKANSSLPAARAEFYASRDQRTSAYTPSSLGSSAGRSEENGASDASARRSLGVPMYGRCKEATGFARIAYSSATRSSGKCR